MESGCRICWAGWLACGSIGVVTVIYLVQHGDKVRVPGDPGLTELGEDQVAAMARWLEGAGLQALFSSPLRRARETAAAIAAATGLPVQLDDRLRERLNWEGTQTFEAFLADCDRSAGDRDLPLIGGESSQSEPLAFSWSSAAYTALLTVGASPARAVRSQ